MYLIPLPRYCFSKVSGLLGDAEPLHTDTGLTHTDSQPADHFTPHSCADTDTSQEVWNPAQKYSPDQDLKLAYSQARLQSKPSVVVGFGFFVQPARKERPRLSH